MTTGLARFDPLVETLEEEVGDDLLGVGYYRGSSYEVLYVRPDFADRYPPHRLEGIAHDMALESVSGEYQEQLLYDFGRLESTIRQFEGGLSIHVPTGDRLGFGVGVEDRSLALVEPVVGYCRAFEAGADDEPTR